MGLVDRVLIQNLPEPRMEIGGEAAVWTEALVDRGHVFGVEAFEP